MTASTQRRTGRLYRAWGAVCAVTCLAPAGCKHSRASTTATAPPVPLTPARTGYVTNNGSDTIAAFDLDGAHVETRSLDIDPDRHEAPHHLAIDSHAGVVFVCLAFPLPKLADDQGPHAGHGRATSNGMLARLSLSTLAVTGTREVDPSPGDVVLTPDKTRVLVTHFDLQRAMQAAMSGEPPSNMFATLQVFDAKTFLRTAERSLCVAPHGIASTQDGKTALVACYGSDELALVDLTSPTLATTRYALGASQGVPGAPRYGPYGVTISPDGSRAVVSELEGQGLRVFDLATRRFVKDEDVATGGRAFLAAFVAPREILVPLQAPDGLVRVDIDTGATIAKTGYRKDECESPHVVRVRPGPSGPRAFVVCEGDHVQPGAVVEIDPRSLAILRRWEVGVYPDGLAFGDE